MGLGEWSAEQDRWPRLRVLAQISRWCDRACQGHICDTYVLGEGAYGFAMTVRRPLLGCGKSGVRLYVLAALDIGSSTFIMQFFGGGPMAF